MKILLIKHGALGDVLRVTPVIHTLSENGYIIDVLTSGIGSKVLKNNPHVNKMYILKNKKNCIKLFFLLKTLKKKHYDYVVNFETMKQIDKFCIKLNYSNHICSSNIKVENPNLNVIDLFYEYIKPIVKSFKKYNNEIYPTDSDINYVNNFLEKFPGDTRKIGIHIGTSKTDRLFKKNFYDVRLWPEENYIKLIKMIVEKKHTVFLTGSKLEKTINKKIIKNVSSRNIVDTAGDFNIQQLHVFINQMDWFISSDTGPAHIAASTPVKQICLCGPTDGKNSAPKDKKNYFLVQKNSDDCPPCYGIDNERKKKCKNNICMKNIKVEDVYNIIVN